MRDLAIIYGRPAKYPWRTTPVGGKFTVPKNKLPAKSGINSVSAAASFARKSGHGSFQVRRSPAGNVVVLRVA